MCSEHSWLQIHACFNVFIKQVRLALVTVLSIIPPQYKAWNLKERGGVHKSLKDEEDNMGLCFPRNILKDAF